MKQYKIKDLCGQKFGYLTVISRADSRKGVPHWKCECYCGKISETSGARLKNGTVKSCGCLKGKRTHGLSHINEYKIWGVIKKRCKDKKNPIYGGRGIQICDRWKDSFENFILDLGQRPSMNHSVERKDNNLGYSPDNCVWATRQEQANNTRHNRKIIFNENVFSLKEFAFIADLCCAYVAKLTREGVSPEEIMEHKNGTRWNRMEKSSTWEIDSISCV